MVTDPVCGMEIDESSSDAIVAVVGGKKNYFCSSECRDEFLKNRS